MITGYFIIPILLIVMFIALIYFMFFGGRARIGK